MEPLLPKEVLEGFLGWESKPLLVADIYGATFARFFFLALLIRVSIAPVRLELKLEPEDFQERINKQERRLIKFRLK